MYRLPGLHCLGIGLSPAAHNPSPEIMLSYCHLNASERKLLNRKIYTVNFSYDKIPSNMSAKCQSFSWRLNLFNVHQVTIKYQTFKLLQQKHIKLFIIFVSNWTFGNEHIQCHRSVWSKNYIPIVLYYLIWQSCKCCNNIIIQNSKLRYAVSKTIASIANVSCWLYQTYYDAWTVKQCENEFCVTDVAGLLQEHIMFRNFTMDIRVW